MLFQREGCKPIQNPSEKKVAFELKRTKSSFANLSAKDGSYIQVAGGPGLFLLEHRNAQGIHFRAFQEKPVAHHPDGTLLQTKAGSISMRKNEWFLLSQVEEAFSNFLHSSSWPGFIKWRAVNVC